METSIILYSKIRYLWMITMNNIHESIPIKEVRYKSNRNIYNMSYIMILIYYMMYRMNVLEYIERYYYTVRKYYIIGEKHGKEHNRIMTKNISNIYRYYDNIKLEETIRRPIINIKIKREMDNKIIDISRMIRVINKHGDNESVSDIIEFNRERVEIGDKLEIQKIGKKLEYILDDKLEVKDIYE